MGQRKGLVNLICGEQLLRAYTCKSERASACGCATATYHVIADERDANHKVVFEEVLCALEYFEERHIKSKANKELGE